MILCNVFIKCVTGYGEMAWKLIAIMNSCLISKVDEPSLDPLLLQKLAIPNV